MKGKMKLSGKFKVGTSGKLFSDLNGEISVLVGQTEIGAVRDISGEEFAGEAGLDLPL